MLFLSLWHYFGLLLSFSSLGTHIAKIYVKPDG